MKQLEEHSLRKTPARIELLQVFSAELRPLDVGEIRARLENRGVSVDQATVYRMLDSFLHHGIITRFEFQEGKFRYELTGEEHHHLVCTSCGTIEDISDCNLSGLEKEIRLKKGFLVKRHSLEFFGLCRNCQQ
jgi:Fur family ferric uptake transcriptional regulator